MKDLIKELTRHTSRFTSFNNSNTRYFRYQLNFFNSKFNLIKNIYLITDGDYVWNINKHLLNKLTDVTELKQIYIYYSKSYQPIVCIPHLHFYKVFHISIFNLNYDWTDVLNLLKFEASRSKYTFDSFNDLKNLFDTPDFNILINQINDHLKSVTILNSLNNQ